MENIDKKDLQGIIVRGYAELPAACFLLIKIKNAMDAKTWLKANTHRFTSGAEKPTISALNIAFTFGGLQSLGLDQTCLETFPMEFEEGMTSRHRKEMLGDYGTSDPANWLWGGNGNDEFHILFMVYEKDENELGKRVLEIETQSDGAGWVIIKKLDATSLIERKEHFGFHDGIAQPTIKGLGRVDSPGNTVAAGEFILGYKNEYGQFPQSPLVSEGIDDKGLLPTSHENRGFKNLGMNGTYMVFRQLEQNVETFWKFMEDKTDAVDGKCNPSEMIRLASKMVGRWPSGAPLVLSPCNDNKEMGDRDEFGYKKTDADGLKCPFGAHIRRSNPRDAIDRGSKDSISIANKHRILRRGRVYGAPVADSMNPEEIIESRDFSGERGLYFICLNTDFNRQFEFVQNFWVNNPKFDGLYDERDPVTGNHSNTYEVKRTGTFSVQDVPVRKRYDDVPEFVTVKGGAYLFLPGISALKFISSL